MLQKPVVWLFPLPFEIQEIIIKMNRKKSFNEKLARFEKIITFKKMTRNYDYTEFYLNRTNNLIYIIYMYDANRNQRSFYTSGLSTCFDY